jgi:hypothetical protein
MRAWCQERSNHQPSCGLLTEVWPGLDSHNKCSVSELKGEPGTRSSCWSHTDFDLPWEKKRTGFRTGFRKSAHLQTRMQSNTTVYSGIEK